VTRKRYAVLTAGLLVIAVPKSHRPTLFSLGAKGLGKMKGLDCAIGSGFARIIERRLSARNGR